jgi:protein-S-isoprenylcysteine O-methyltransferase Ste14
MTVAARAVLAGIAATAFVLVALVWRDHLQRRWTGASGVALRRFGVTPAERVTAAMMATAAGAIAVAIGAGLAGYPLGGPQRVDAAIVVAGCVLATTAIAATFWSQGAMGASWRVGLDRSERTELVTGGPYRYVRHPIYTSMGLFVAALFVVLPGLPLAIAMLALLVGVEVSVRRVEEPLLRERHDRAYDDWAAHTGRFIPGLGITHS